MSQKLQLLIALLALVAVEGCRHPSDDTGIDAQSQELLDEQVKTFHRQTAEFDKNTEQANALMARQEEQTKRYDKILDKLSEQAKRQDAILAAQEKKLGIGE